MNLRLLRSILPILGLGLILVTSASAEISQTAATTCVQQWATLVAQGQADELGQLLHESYQHIHGTGLVESKTAFLEANALRAALGTDADHVAVSATKSMTGHLLGGAGAIESVFIVKTLQDRLAPPTINIDDLDPAVTVDVVRDKPRALPAGDIAALNDSFGFGGHNVVLVFKSI